MRKIIGVLILLLDSIFLIRQLYFYRCFGICSSNDPNIYQFPSTSLTLTMLVFGGIAILGILANVVIASKAWQGQKIHRNWTIVFIIANMSLLLFIVGQILVSLLSKV